MKNMILAIKLVFVLFAQVTHFPSERVIFVDCMKTINAIGNCFIGREKSFGNEGLGSFFFL